MSEEHPVVGTSPRDPLVGSVLGDRYRIERKLGEGGMGAVYLARHVILEKLVALKILHDEYARRRELVERFLHEAKAASRIRHEHVIDITDFGETATKNVFFAMEFLDGHDLASELDRGQVGWPRIRSIILQICAALQAAHEAGVIHRDLKPENIYLIERLGNADYVKVLDFGVAKLTELEEGKERRLTRTGMVFGTPEYMSPEQARGEKPDSRVDVYALGCILFEMVTGDVPFRADNFMGVLTKHLFDPQPLVAERTARTDLPPGLQDVITQALAKDKSQRFGSMNELAVAIDTLDNSEGVMFQSGAEKARRVETERGREKADGRREVAHALTTPAPTDDIAPARRPIVGQGASDEEASPPRRRGRWAVIGAVVALVLATSGVVIWQLAGEDGKPAPAQATTPTPPTEPAVTKAPTPSSPAAAEPAIPPPPAAAVTPPPETTPPRPPEPAAAPEPEKGEAEAQKAGDIARKAVKRPVVRHVVPPPHPAAGASSPSFTPTPVAEPPPPSSSPGPGPGPGPGQPAEPKSDLKNPFGGK